VIIRLVVDLKLVADQLGYGLGVNLDVYTIAGLDAGGSCQRRPLLPDRCVLLLITLHGTSAHT
jgi:hypothetical protein